MSECYAISLFFIQLFLGFWSLIVGGMGWYVIVREVQHGSRHELCLELYPLYRLIFSGDQTLTEVYLAIGIISSFACFSFGLAFVINEFIVPNLPCIVLA